MTDEAALLAAILGRPGDDTPRLVFADYLDDAGEPDRAAFIRVQVELARAPSCCPACTPDGGHRDGCVNGERGDELRRRERELWARHGRTWLAGSPLGKYDLTWQDLVIWRRGFPDELRVPTLATLFGGEYPACSGEGTTPGIAAAVFAAHPVMRVMVRDREPHGIGRVGVSWWKESVPRHPMSGIQDTARVPDEVYTHLESAAGGYTVGRCTYHLSRAAAVEALSRACVDLGRSRAGLPPIA